MQRTLANNQKINQPALRKILYSKNFKPNRHVTKRDRQKLFKSKLGPLVGHRRKFLSWFSVLISGLFQLCSNEVGPISAVNFAPLLSHTRTFSLSPSLSLAGALRLITLSFSLTLSHTRAQTHEVGHPWQDFSGEVWLLVYHSLLSDPVTPASI